MGIWKRDGQSWWSRLVLLLLVCAWPVAASTGVPLVLQELQVPQGYGVDVDVDTLRSGDFEGVPVRPESPWVHAGRRGEVSWWRITTVAPLSVDSRPQLVLRSPFLNRVQAWVPGSEAPSRHALYGPDADPAHSHRALVIDLPEGIPAGTAVWLRVEAGSSMKMPVAIEPLDQVRRADLAYVAWRSFVFAVLLVLALLAFVFRVGTGESSFAWFGAMLCFAILYLMAFGGDARLLPGAAVVFDWSRANVILGGLGVVCSNLFQRAYLDLPRKLPRLDRLLWVGTALAGTCGVGAVFVILPGQVLIGNAGLILSAFLLLAGSTTLALRGDRAGRVVMASWLPLMVFTTLVASELMGLWSGPLWLAEGLAGSFALAGLLLAIGLADKLLELRRDRDHASARAFTDDLTGLFNRAGVDAELRRKLQEAAERGVAMSIAYVDIDNFKPINDEHGHGVGDQCLRVVSQRIRNQLRGEDIIGRYGGDEFLAVLPATKLADALAIADRMLASVTRRPLTIGSLRLDASLSVGVAEFGPGDTAESLIERADAALYASKQAGRSRVTGTGREEPGLVAAST